MAPEDDNLEAMFRGRCTHEQKRQWEQAARLAKRSLSDWLRMVADEAAERALKPAAENQTLNVAPITITPEQLAAMLGMKHAAINETRKKTTRRDRK